MSHVRMFLCVKYTESHMDPETWHIVSCPSEILGMLFPWPCQISTTFSLFNLVCLQHGHTCFRLQLYSLIVTISKPFRSPTETLCPLCSYYTFCLPLIRLPITSHCTFLLAYLSSVPRMLRCLENLSRMDETES